MAVVAGHKWRRPTAFFCQSSGDCGRQVAPLIRYEQLVVWPVLQSMFDDPDLIVAVGNGWWTKGTTIVAIQRASAVAWAKLFAKPLVLPSTPEARGDAALDAALIKECADPTLKPAIVEQFVSAAGLLAPLAVTVKSGGRLILVPKATSADEAMAIVRQYVGRWFASA